MFNYQNFLKVEFEGLHNVPILFLQYGFTAPEESAVIKWSQRNSVPSAWFPLLLALLELERGQPVSLGRYIIR